MGAGKNILAVLLGGLAGGAKGYGDEIAAKKKQERELELLGKKTDLSAAADQAKRAQQFTDDLTKGLILSNFNAGLRGGKWNPVNIGNTFGDSMAEGTVPSPQPRFNLDFNSILNPRPARPAATGGGGVRRRPLPIQAAPQVIDLNQFRK